MATDIVGSLFGVTPEVLQQRQMEMADRQAMEYAQLSPLQRASYGLARGGYQLAGALGGQDPQLRMISNRNAIARQIDPTNLESMQMGIQALQQAGDSVGAMQLAQVFRQAENDMALRSQREAAAMASRAAATRERSQAVPTSIQEANRISQITQALQTMELQPYERMALEAEMQQLRKTSTSDALAVAERIGNLTRSLADPNLPELDRRVLQAQYDQLSKAAGQKPNVPDAIQVAQRISALTKQLQDPELAPIERMAFEAEITQLRKTEREGALPASLQLADAISSAQAKVDELESQPPSPERERALVVAKRRVENLERQAPQPRGQAPSAALQLANAIATTETEIATIESQPQSPERDAKLAAAKRKLAALERQSPQPRTPAQAPALQLAAEIANKQAVVDALRDVPASADRDAALRRATTELDALQRQLPQAREAGVKVEVLGVAQGTNKVVYVDKNTDEQFMLETVDGKSVRKPYTGAVSRITSQTEVKVEVPGVKPVFDTAGMRSKVQATIQRPLDAIISSDQALQAIDDSIKSNNFVSFNAARVQLAKALGDSQLSRRDVEQAGGDPSLLGGLYDATSRLFTGTPSIDTQNKIKATLNAIRIVASRQANQEIETQRAIALATPGADVAAVNRALTFPQLQQRATAAGAGAGAGAGSLADQARAELERRRQAGGR